MEKEELKGLIREGESEVVEFKGSLKLHNSIGEAISAFSNSKGGIILIGIEDSGKISGVDLGNNTLEKLANRIKVDTDPSIYPKISSNKLDGKDMIVIEIEEYHEKPVFYKDKAYKRVGKSTHRLNASEMRKLAKNSGSKIYWDEQICERATLDDIDEDKVREFLKTAENKRDLDMRYNSIQDALRKLDVLRDGRLTNACALMFTKESQRFFLQSEIKCGRFKGTSTKEFIDMAEFSGPVHEQVDRSEKFVLRNIRKAAWIEPGKIERQEKWEYPLDAVREAITNAVVHRDYQSTSNVQIRIFDDRIEVWNPGTLPEGWTVDTLKEEHESKPFNPLLARMFFLIKFIEKWGRGTIDMVEDCIEHGIPEPDFKDTGTSLVVTFRKSKLTDGYREELDLNERQKKAMVYLMQHKKITRSKYESLFDCSKKTAYNDLQDLVDKEIINRKGKGKNTYYIFPY
ncbi:MAG: helix-turn-helix domain-containing protein [Thermoplasmata archaeon]